TWAAQALPDDFREDTRKDAKLLDKLLGGSLLTAMAIDNLKPGLVFEDFSWEAKGLRAPPASLPPKPFEQKGSFYSPIAQEGVVFYQVPYDSPPNVELSGAARQNTVVVECNAKSFKWRNTAKDNSGWAGELT